MSARRALFVTPVRPTKRRRLAPPRRRRPPPRIPKSMLPEMKNFRSGTLSTSGSNYAYSSISNTIVQGDDGNDYIGSKYRMHRIRVMYDYSQLSLTSAVRLMLVITKDPSTTPTAILSSATTPVDPHSYTVLHDMLLPDSPDALAGTFDWTGPLNVEMSQIGGTVLRNNVWLLAYSTSNGTNISSKTSFSVWFTDN